jgi:hypothetical protein
MFLRLVNMNSKSKIANLKMKEPKWRTETLQSDEKRYIIYRNTFIRE